MFKRPFSSSGKRDSNSRPSAWEADFKKNVYKHLIFRQKKGLRTTKRQVLEYLFKHRLFSKYYPFQCNPIISNKIIYPLGLQNTTVWIFSHICYIGTSYIVLPHECFKPTNAILCFEHINRVKKRLVIAIPSLEIFRVQVLVTVLFLVLYLLEF